MHGFTGYSLYMQTHVYVFVHTYTQHNMHARIHTHIQTHTYIHMHIHIHRYSYTFTWTHRAKLAQKTDLYAPYFIPYNSVFYSIYLRILLCLVRIETISFNTDQMEKNTELYGVKYGPSKSVF